jgi:hypothetical protein
VRLLNRLRRGFAVLGGGFHPRNSFGGVAAYGFRREIGPGFIVRRFLMMRLRMMLIVVMFIMMLIVGGQFRGDRRRNEGEGNGPVLMIIVMIMVVIMVVIVVRVIMVMMLVMSMVVIMMVVMMIIMMLVFMMIFVVIVMRAFGEDAFTRLAFAGLAFAGLRGGSLGFAARAAARLTFFFFPLVTFLLGDQPFTVGDGDLIVVGVNFAEGEEPMAVPTVIDEGGLQRRFDADDFGEVDVAFDLFLCRCLYIKFLKARSIQNHHPSFLGVCGIDQHSFDHSKAYSVAPRTARMSGPWVRRAGRGGKLKELKIGSADGHASAAHGRTRSSG